MEGNWRGQNDRKRRESEEGMKEGHDYMFKILRNSETDIYILLIYRVDYIYCIVHVDVTWSTSIFAARSVLVVFHSSTCVYVCTYADFYMYASPNAIISSRVKKKDKNEIEKRNWNQR